MDSATIEKLAAQCEEAGIARVSDYFDENRNRAGADRTMLGQAELFLRLGASLRTLAVRRTANPG